MEEFVKYLFIVKSTPIIDFNGTFKNNVVVIYKKSLSRTTRLGGNKGYLLCIETFLWFKSIIQLK